VKAITLPPWYMCVIAHATLLEARSKQHFLDDATIAPDAIAASGFASG
jgi:hypothetical protein